ncbi:MAG: MMPL family transporter [Clostridia bacterium]|nr:MMPL family transporter [[Bacteroides] pectinophilus]MDD5872554.1 MMPL family transporter [Clostridia bacterium]
MKENSQDKNFMYKLAEFIVDKRNLFFLIYIIALVFCIFSRNWVKVENDVTKYLPESTETRQGLTVMNDQFVTYGTAQVLLANISYDRAQEAADMIEDINGVTSVTFDNTEDHYKGTSALLDVTFDGEEEDQISIDAMNEIKDKLAGYDVYYSTSVANDDSANLESEMQVVTAIAAVIIVVVLLLTSKSYAEVPVLLITFIAAALLNMGTNFLLGTISFISNSVTIVLQLALAIDYAIILCHRYTEERENLPAREATITALSKAIPEISSSSLTTVSGLLALAFMQFKIGEDLAVVLIKAIILSLLSVFTLMPGLIMVFSKWMDKTVHKNLIPSISAVGKFAIKTKYIIPPIFAVVIVVACVLANMCPYCFSTGSTSTPRKSESTIAQEKIDSTFGSKNMIALVVPAGNYDAEKNLLADLDACDEVKSTQGLANTEAMDGYMLTDSLTPREFSELVGLDYEVAQLLYSAYAINQEDYGEVINSSSKYSVPLIDMFEFLLDEIDKGYVTLEGDLKDQMDDLSGQLDKALLQLKTDDYSRLVVYLNLPEEGDETFAFLDRVHEMMAKYYTDNYYVVGNSTSDYDLSSSFSRDNLVISILSALFVIIILLFTFKSAGLPVLLILVIQGSIWINFSFPYLLDSPLYFLGYLVVNSIQMGANIDYAIVISSRYDDLKKQLPIKEAIIETLNQAFPTIITSGSILAAAGILISFLSTNGVISAIGTCLGRGTIISIILVMGVLPQILYLGDVIIEKTRFSINTDNLIQNTGGTMVINGRMRGYVSGIIDAEIHGVIKGEVKGQIDVNNIDVVKKEEPKAIEDGDNGDNIVDSEAKEEPKDGGDGNEEA